MLIRRLRPAQGYCFAWWPVTTAEGVVWLEHVRYKWSNAEFGGYTFERLLRPDMR